MRTDAATLEVVRNALISIPETMGSVLKRTAYSPNIKERMDHSCAIFDRDGRLIAQAEHIPVHLGSMPITVRSVLDHLAKPLADGSQLLTNDPYLGGTHIPDITIIKPIFVGKRLYGFAVNRAHHADMGGLSPGSMPGVSTDIFQEGLRLPPCNIVERGVENADLMKLLLANTRTPLERIGDIRAQLAANNIGAIRVREFIRKHGERAFGCYIHDLIAYSRKRMQNAIARIPKGVYTACEYLDDDGVSDEPIELCVAVEVTERRLKFDFSGTADSVMGNLNAPLAVTTAAIYYAIRCITDPAIPPNHGCYEMIKIIVPEGTILNPPPGAAVSAGNVETSQRIVDLIFSALAPAMPDTLGGQSQGTMNNILIGGSLEDGSAFTYYETLGGGEGALPYRAGQDGIQVHMTNTANTPVEVVESSYPIRVEKYELIPDSGGSGLHRGGMGLRRVLRVLAADAVLSIQSERRKFAPQGSRGGMPGRCGRNYLLRDGMEIVLPSKTVVRLNKGDIIIIETPGGGGFGKDIPRI